MMDKTKVENNPLYLTRDLLLAVLKKKLLAITSITLLVTFSAGYYLSTVKSIHRIDVNITSDYDREELFELYVMLPSLFDTSFTRMNSADGKMINDYKQSFHIEDFDTLYYLEDNIFSVKLFMSKFDGSPIAANEFVTLLNNLSFTSGFVQKQLQKREVLIKLLDETDVNKKILKDAVDNLLLNEGENIELFRIVNSSVPYQNHSLKEPNVLVSTFALFVTVFIALFLLFAQMSLSKKDRI
jgi:hypothetical protein